MNKQAWQKLVNQSLRETPEHFTDRLYELMFPVFTDDIDFEVRQILAEFSTKTAMSQDDAVERLQQLYEKGTIVSKDQREFPEEAVTLCQKFDTYQRWFYDPVAEIPPPEYSLTNLLADLKHLWEGTGNAPFITFTNRDLTNGQVWDSYKKWRDNSGKMPKDDCREGTNSPYPQSDINGKELLAEQKERNLSRAKTVDKGTGATKIPSFQEKPKGGCPTCGGSRIVPVEIDDADGNPIHGADYCPDCEQRKGERREPYVYSWGDMLVGNDPTRHQIYTRLGKDDGWKINNRIGKERRNGKAGSD